MKDSKRNAQQMASLNEKRSVGKPVQSNYGMKHRPEPKEKDNG